MPQSGSRPAMLCVCVCVGWIVRSSYTVYPTSGMPDCDIYMAGCDLWESFDHVLCVAFAQHQGENTSVLHQLTKLLMHVMAVKSRNGIPQNNPFMRVGEPWLKSC